MSENPDEIYGDGIIVSGKDITWYRATGDDVAYSFTDARPFTLREEGDE